MHPEIPAIYAALPADTSAGHDGAAYLRAVAFDGRSRVEFKQGDHIKVTASKYPFPTNKQSTD